MKPATAQGIAAMTLNLFALLQVSRYNIYYIAPQRIILAQLCKQGPCPSVLTKLSSERVAMVESVHQAMW